MSRNSRLLVLTAALAASAALPAHADSVFNRIASFPVTENLPAGTDAKAATSSEIIKASTDGKTLIYSDSPLGAIGFIDISDAKAPKAAGIVKFEGEPTSVTVAGDKVLAAINTSKSFTEPSGHLAVIDLATKKVEATCDLGGQPDSIAVSADGKFAAIAIENERDEELNDGELPQLPAGDLKIFNLTAGVPDCASMKTVDLTGLAEVGAEDPEPEFVDFNAAGEIALTLQENNHIAIIDAATGKVTAHFSAGSVDLEGVDTKKDGALNFSGTMKGVLREPDAIKWLDNDRFVTANEGDYKGGSRGFTIFDKTGKVLYESGPSLEMKIAAAGHYPDKRNKKGAEIEGLEVATFNGTRYIFVGAERSSVIAVYKDTGAEPEFVQLLPSGVSPEGLVAIPGRNLLATANELDLVADGGVRSHVMLYELGEGPATYPMVVSANDDAGKPIGWGALSGLAADPKEAGKLYAVSDSFYRSQPAIFTLDATKTPAQIVKKLVVTRDGQPAQKLDLEGIASDGKDGFWLASEGDAAKLTPNAVFHVDAKGEIDKEFPLPAELLGKDGRFGYEGITTLGEGDDLTLVMAVQREWADDAKGEVKLLAYKPKAKEWSAVRYPLEKAEKGWIGLSEITAHNGKLYIIERDNQIGTEAKLKAIYAVALEDFKPTKLGGELPLVKKTLVRNLVADLKAATNGYVVDKMEGFAIDASGDVFVVTDNDGVDDSSGETLFLRLGNIASIN